MLEIISEFWQYLIKNPLELPAFIISFLAFLYTRKKIKASYAKINLEIVYGSPQTWYQLKIYSPEKGQPLFIKELPLIYKRNILFYKKLDYFVDYSHEIDSKTNEPIQGIYYIHLEKLTHLEKGKYMIKVKVDLLPHVLKYKFSIPLVPQLKNQKQLIG